MAVLADFKIARPIFSWWDSTGIVVATTLAVAWFTHPTAALLYVSALWLGVHAFVDIEVMSKRRSQSGQTSATVLAYRELVDTKAWHPSGVEEDRGSYTEDQRGRSDAPSVAIRQ